MAAKSFFFFFKRFISSTMDLFSPSTSTLLSQRNTKWKNDLLQTWLTKDLRDVIQLMTINIVLWK